MKKKTANILIGLGILLIISSLAFNLYLKVDENKKRQGALETEEKFLWQIEISQKEDRSQVHKVEEQEVVVTGDEIESDQVIGVIRIDKLGILAEVYDNTHDSTLLKGVGLIERTDMPSSKPGTSSAIAGHRGGRNEKLSFINIDKLEAGDEVKLTTKDEVLVYEIVGQEVVEPDDWSKFYREEDKSKLTLMACHPYPQNHKRILLKAELK